MPYFVSENFDPRIIGSLNIYKDEQTLLYGYEPWYEEIGHLVFDTDGNCFRIVAHGNVLSLKKIKSKVDPECVARFMKYYESEYDLSLCPDQVVLLEDHQDYVVETPRPLKQELTKLLSKWKFWASSKEK